MSVINGIVVATKNEGKLREIKAILKDLNINILSLNDFDDIGEVEENGFSFYENALIKAKAVYKVTNLPTLADDSGLCVEFLDGMPGIFSARFAADSINLSSGNTDDEKNNDKLLNLMKGLPHEERRAYFKCAMVLMYAEDIYITASGKLHGYIADEKRGTNGFGYDSVFYLPDSKMNSAEISPDEKNKISHRFKALLEIKKKLENI
ncbi:RdgB/HAM1 family non-canonical purine NTP pyrophosphatase [Thermodesulfobacteriota bacterium]